MKITMGLLKVAMREHFCRSLRLAGRIGVFAVAWGWLACTGTVLSEERADGTTDRRGGNSAQGGMAGNTPLSPDRFTTSPGLRRLTQSEYTHAIFDLTGVHVDRARLPRDLVVQGHGHIAGAQKTGYDDSNRYLDVADGVAEQAAARVLAEAGCTTADCYRTFVQGFLLRAFRGPPDSPTLERYVAILTSTSTQAGSTPAERMTAFLSAVFSSPHFLYRKELGQPVPGQPNVRALDNYELASRLSFLVWGSGPDAALLDAASSGALQEPGGRAAELRRLLRDARAARGLRAFVSDWMALFDNQLSHKSERILQGTGSNFPNEAQQAFDLLVDDVLSQQGARFSDLLRSEHAFANATLATILGAQRTASDPAAFVRVALDTVARRGILTHPLVIGAHSKEEGPSPFPIGKFIYENVLCEEIPTPPQVFPNIEDSTFSDQTLRQRLEAMTAGAACVGCHSRIGPPGFAFLSFDPIGRYNARDAAGRPFDTTGDLHVGAEQVAFTSAADLSAKLAELPHALQCLGTRLFRFAHGRFEASADASLIQALGQEAVTTRAGIDALLVRLVSSPDFARARVVP